MARSYQAVVIGGGPGGYVTAIRLGQLGVKAAMIEREYVGGVCLNWGCIPSKAVIHVSHLKSHLEVDGPEIGLTASGLSLDLEKTRVWKNKIVKKLTSGVRQLVKTNDTEIVEGEATFAGPGRLRVRRKDGEEEEIGYEQCVIATGARPIEIPGLEYDGDVVWSAREAVDLPEIPKRLTVIGGGIIGLELGTAYAKLGSEVTVVEMLDRLLTGVDRDLVQVVERRLKKLGVRIVTGGMARSLERRKKGGHVLTVGTDKGEERLEPDRVLVAVGFRPNRDRLALEKVGVHVAGSGAIPVDETMQTNVDGVYAIGDVTGGPFLAHRAFKQGETVAEVIAGEPAAYDIAALPAAIFTDPEIATTGLSEEEARRAGHEVKIGKFMLSANGRALGTAETQGFAKAVVDAESGALLGLHIVAAGASELVSEGTLGIEMGALADDLGLTIHPHPTFSEAVHEATLAALGKAIHMLNR